MVKTEDKGEIGLRIRILRKHYKLSLKELSEIVSIDDSNLGKIERGQINPSLRLISKLHSAYDVPLAWLIKGKGNMLKLPIVKCKRCATKQERIKELESTKNRIGIAKRIEIIIEYEHLKVSVLEREIGASIGVLRKAIKNNTEIGFKWVERIYRKYPKYNTVWLLTGEGKVFIEESNKCEVSQQAI